MLVLMVVLMVVPLMVERELLIGTHTLILVRPFSYWLLYRHYVRCSDAAALLMMVVGMMVVRLGRLCLS